MPVLAWKSCSQSVFARMQITYAVLAYVFQQASVRLRPILTMLTLLVSFPPEARVIW